MHLCEYALHDTGGSRAAATSKMERFLIMVNGFQPLTIITKRSILDIAAVLDPPRHEKLKFHPISSRELLWKSSKFPKLIGNCAFPQKFHTRKLGEILVFHAVVYADAMNTYLL